MQGQKGAAVRKASQEEAARQWVLKHKQEFTRWMKWEIFKQRKQRQSSGDKMGKLEAQIKCRGSGRKSRGSDPPGFYSSGEEESLKRVGQVGVGMGGR